MPNAAFGARLRQLRKARGLSQEALAASLRTTQQTLSNWERGNFEPDIDDLASLAASLDVAVDDLIGRPRLSVVATGPHAVAPTAPAPGLPPQSATDAYLRIVEARMAQAAVSDPELAFLRDLAEWIGVDGGRPR